MVSESKTMELANQLTSAHRSRRRQHRLHRARLTLEERLLRNFNARLRDELLNGKICYSLREAQIIIIEGWRRHYNTRRPYSALGYRPPAPETINPMDQRPVMH